MKKFNGEKFSIVIIITILLIISICLIYNILNSNKNLISNNTEFKKQEEQTNSNNNSNTTKNPESPVKEEKKETTEKNTNEVVEKESELSTYTTTIYDKDDNRVHNISLAISKLNGKILNPDETFSFNDTIGPMNEKQGFKKALGFDSKGNKIQISGGGLCQISSTLYNAVLQVNLPVLERHPHSKRVYYVAKDKDATIAYGSLDFKFKNNLPEKIKIYARNDNTSVKITIVKIIN